MAWWRPRAAAAGLVLAALMMTGCGELDTVVVDEEAAGSTAEPQTASATESAEPEERATADDEPAEDAADAESGSALAMLHELEVKGRAPKSGYDRDLFRWREDTDRNGCDTRNDVLRRDLTGLTLKAGGCVVLGGTLTSDYTGDTFDFIRGDGNNIDIDHVVALSNAWQTGAQGLSEDELVELANDPINLLAVESSVNRSKGDGDAATWLPPRKGYRCEYVARQIRVKHDYGLWVTPPEFDAMERLLLDCDEDEFGEDDWPGRGGGDVRETVSGSSGGSGASGGSGTGRSGGSGGASSGGSGSGSTGSGGAGESSSGSAGSGSVYFENCTAARDAGAAPVHVGDPGYASHLDRDGDGVGCE
ncbi:MAG TPA: excalibur calcium-binding domain-containing protein [Brevibacterium senegalense]|uniref:Excalibur calcium-binding domain-containing protein n=1 Tax=Brevibacterium senegalense TaxID=1033736 RepID=A0A921MFB6_9MICO|nr:excalibur calcium-binding domain-containing protein [Brevibacterium senegalense]